MGHLDYFVSGKGYAGGKRPYCKMCQNKDLRAKRGLEPKDWTPRFNFKQEEVFSTDERLNILITNGFARNEEEARRYIGL